MNYKLSVDEYVSVIETATDQIIKKFDNVESARKFLRHLNLGGGFDGWSPTFFLKDLTSCINNARNENKKASYDAEARDAKGQKE